MNKLMIAIALCAALAACKKQETTPVDATAPAADTAAATDTTAAAASATGTAAGTDLATAPVNSGLPQECEDYLNRTKACFAKANGNVAAIAFQEAVDHSKGQWEAMADKSALPAVCKQADDHFAQTAAVLKCE